MTKYRDKYDIQIREMYKRQSALQIANSLGIAPMTVRNRLVAMGIPILSDRKSPTYPSRVKHLDMEVVLEMYKTKSADEIANHFGVAWGTVRKRLAEVGVKVQRHKGINAGEKNGIWKGNNVGYTGLHLWVKRHFPKPKLCQGCKLVPPLDLANISQEYKRDLSDWEWLCRRCHMTKDGRMGNLKQFRASESEQNHN